MTDQILYGQFVETHSTDAAAQVLNNAAVEAHIEAPTTQILTGAMAETHIEAPTPHILSGMFVEVLVPYLPATPRKIRNSFISRPIRGA